MSVDLNPHVQLGFPRPLTQLVKRSLQVSNPNSQPVAFKVKTTAPKQYCVRPNSGRIEPGEKVEVQVLLQPMKEEPPTAAKCRDKFLVQSTIITPERETTSLNDLWGIVEKENKNEIHEQKIRCAFLPAASASVPEEGEEVGSSMTNGGDDKYSTVRGTPSRNGTSPNNDDGSFSSPAQNGQQLNPIAAAQNAAANTDGGALASARNAAVAAGGATVAAGGAALAATKNAGTRAVGGEKSSADLQAEIKRLQSQLDAAGRKGAQQVQQAADGVSLQVVGVLMFASLLLGIWLF